MLFGTPESPLVPRLYSLRLAPRLPPLPSHKYSIRSPCSRQLRQHGASIIGTGRASHLGLKYLSARATLP
jgi:hypothetical protein